MFVLSVFFFTKEHASIKHDTYRILHVVSRIQRRFRVYLLFYGRKYQPC